MRDRITLRVPPTALERLDDVADREYGGNRSEAARAAIESFTDGSLTVSEPTRETALLADGGDDTTMTETESPGVSVEEAKGRIIDALEVADGVVGLGELLEWTELEGAEDVVEAAIDELQMAGELRYSGRKGGYLTTA